MEEGCVVKICVEAGDKMLGEGGNQGCVFKARVCGGGRGQECVVVVVCGGGFVPQGVSD